jgi:glutamate/tyrosine decarboxylase-like PLP-dependent enzyme
MMLRHYGLAGYRDLLRKNVACAAHLDGRVRDHEDFLAVQEPNLYIYSFRYVPADLRPDLDPDHPGHERVSEYLDELTVAAVDDVVASGLAFLGTTTIRGRRALRTSICSHRTTLEDVDATFDALAAAGDRIDGTWREDASLPV